jgi:Putative phage serine protease XkdF
MRVIVEDGERRVTIDGGVVAKEAQEAWDGTSIAAKLIKSAPERRYTLHCAYPALKADVVVAADGHKDFASPEAVENAAWSFLTKSPKIGLWHENGTEGAGRVVESYIHRSGDWTITAADGSTQVIKTGDWLLGVQWEPSTWQMIKDGRIKGVSMQGSATRRKPSREALASLRNLSALPPGTPPYLRD